MESSLFSLRLNLIGRFEDARSSSRPIDFDGQQIPRKTRLWEHLASSPSPFSHGGLFTQMDEQILRQKGEGDDEEEDEEVRSVGENPGDTILTILIRRYRLLAHAVAQLDPQRESNDPEQRSGCMHACRGLLPIPSPLHSSPPPTTKSDRLTTKELRMQKQRQWVTGGVCTPGNAAGVGWGGDGTISQGSERLDVG